MRLLISILKRGGKIVIMFDLAIGKRLHRMYFRNHSEMDNFIQHLYSFSREKFTYEWKELSVD